MCKVSDSTRLEPNQAVTYTMPKLRTVVSGRFMLKRSLGAGGCSEVFLAEDLEHHREVAVKIGKPTVQSGRMRREAAALERLRGSRVPEHIASGEHSGLPYLALGFHDGITLKLLVESHSGGIPPDQAARLVLETSEPLAAAHRQGILHRDVKPQNIILTFTGEVVLIDFGTALMFRDEVSGSAVDDTENPEPFGRTDNGVVLGTCGYISPEQAGGKGSGPIDPRADVYSLGCTLYTLLTGQIPFVGRADSESFAVLSILQAHRTEPVRTPRAIVPGIPSVLAKIVTRAGALNPNDRYPTVEAMAKELRAFLARCEPQKLADIARPYLPQSAPDIATMKTVVLAIAA